MPSQPHILYVVATPIGNLEDIGARALRVLGDAAVVAAEDTRRTRQLLSHWGIRNTLVSLHEHNEAARVEYLLECLRERGDVALVSDAGTPLISDPGFKLVREARAGGFAVSPVPGPSAALAALCVSGLPTDRFAFEGFLPAAAGARRNRILALQEDPRTLVFYASVHRFTRTMEELRDGLGRERQAFVARELTKRHESVHGGTLSELAAAAAGGGIELRGEFVVVVAGAASQRPASDVDRLLGVLLDFLPPREAARAVARLSGERANALYRRALKIAAGESR